MVGKRVWRSSRKVVEEWLCIGTGGSEWRWLGGSSSREGMVGRGEVSMLLGRAEREQSLCHETGAVGEPAEDVGDLVVRKGVLYNEL